MVCPIETMLWVMIFWNFEADVNEATAVDPKVLIADC